MIITAIFIIIMTIIMIIITIIIIIGWTVSMKEYILRLVKAKLWIGTLSEVDLVSPRLFDVMATNRTMLLINRPDDQRVLRGLIEEGLMGNAVIFDDYADFLSKVQYYSTHEKQRLAIVHRAYESVRMHHDWSHRAELIMDILRASCPI